MSLAPKLSTGDGKGKVSRSNQAADVDSRHCAISSFARRDTLYYSAPAVRDADAFIITCTVSSDACPPAGAWLNLYRALPSNVSPVTNSLPAQGARWTGSDGGWKGVAGGNGAMTGARKLVPKTVVDSFASLFDDETYSDVEFWLPSRSKRSRKVQDKHTPMEGGQHDIGHEPTTINMTTTTTAQSVSPPLAVASSSTSLSNDAELLTESPEKHSVRSADAGQMTQSSTISAPSLKIPHSHYRKIWANKKILLRGEFFEDLLSGTFSEGNDPPVSRLEGDYFNLFNFL